MTCQRCGSDGAPLNGCISLFHIELKPQVDLEVYQQVIEQCEKDMKACTRIYLLIYPDRPTF